MDGGWEVLPATIPAVDVPDDLPQPEHPDLELVRHGDGLQLCDHGEPRHHPIRVDFLKGPTALRARGISRKRHPLARAVGRSQPLPDILDGTAGLGRDAFALACLGYRVTAMECCPVLHALLADGVTRLLAAKTGADMVGDRLLVRSGDCRDRFATPPPPEVIYLDPMFPHREKSALVKKEMRTIQKLLGTTVRDDDPEADSRALLAAARRAAVRRVVVKRPRGAAELADDVSYSVCGTKVRWDVYLTMP